MSMASLERALSSMTLGVKVLVAQFNPIVGDIEQNLRSILATLERGKEGLADLILFPELALTGYPPEDLLLLPDFLAQVERALSQVLPQVFGIEVVLGLPRRVLGEKGLANSAVWIADGEVVGYFDKQRLPTYDIFDERRYFEPGTTPLVRKVRGVSFGVTICEDVWDENDGMTSYRQNPLQQLVPLQPDVVLNLSASPYHMGKEEKRIAVFQKAAQTVQAPLLFCNQVGANDGLIFEGGSFLMGPRGVLTQAPAFVEADFWVSLPCLGNGKEYICAPDPMERLAKALVLGIKDYVRKTGFESVCLGLSGGIDSAVVACLARLALGKERVVAFYLPSRFSSQESGEDARELADQLGIGLQELSIEEPFQSYLKVLGPFLSSSFGLTEQNLQARVRGTLLMAFANQWGILLLNTSNKSEAALGYATLYGDLAGAFGVIGDLFKTDVYQLGRWLQNAYGWIPERVFQKAPSAELAEGQKDSDTLPDYALLDPILKAYLEEGKTEKNIAEEVGVSAAFVGNILLKLRAQEYKRKQSPFSLRVSPRSFSFGWRFPIVERYNPLQFI